MQHGKFLIFGLERSCYGVRPPGHLLHRFVCLQALFRDLLDLVEQTCNDTWELYTDLQLYNPYTEEMVEKLKVSTEKLDNQLNELRNVADK